MNQTQLDGITKARLVANIAKVSKGDLYADDAAYITAVCASAKLEALPDSAADSYAAKHAGKTILDLETELAAAIDAARDKHDAPDLPAPTIAGVPTSVEMAQARLALLSVGVTSNAVEAVIDAMPEPQCSVARIEWEFRPRVRRHSALVVAIGAELNLTDAQIDDLFTFAATL